MNKRFPIYNLKHWNAGIWQAYETKTNLLLSIHIDQLLITDDADDGKILETLNMNGKLKGTYKGDVIILILTENSQEVRKIKFQIKSNTVAVLRHLGHCFPVSKHRSTKMETNIKFRNIDMHFQTALNKIENGTLNFLLPENYKDIVKVCLLDPAFPQIVVETQNILNEAGISENKTS